MLPRGSSRGTSSVSGSWRAEFGSPTQGRTVNLLSQSQALCQLSYGAPETGRRWAGRGPHTGTPDVRGCKRESHPRGARRGGRNAALWCCRKWRSRKDSHLRPAVSKTAALLLSYGNASAAGPWDSHPELPGFSMRCLCLLGQGGGMKLAEARRTCSACLSRGHDPFSRRSWRAGPVRLPWKNGGHDGCCPRYALLDSQVSLLFLLMTSG